MNFGFIEDGVISRHHPLSVDHQRYWQLIIIDADFLIIDGIKLLQETLQLDVKKKLKMIDLNYFRGDYV